MLTTTTARSVQAAENADAYTQLEFVKDDMSFACVLVRRCRGGMLLALPVASEEAITDIDGEAFGHFGLVTVEVAMPLQLTN